MGDVDMKRSPRVYTKSVLFGNVARKLETVAKRGDLTVTHEFTVFLRGFDNQDISYIVKQVEIQLHSSMEQPRRVIRYPPFETSCVCYAESDINIRVTFIDEAEADPVDLRFPCVLFPQTSGSRADIVIHPHVDTFVFPFPSLAFEGILNRGPVTARQPSPLDKMLAAINKSDHHRDPKATPLAFPDMADLQRWEAGNAQHLAKTYDRLSREAEKLAEKQKKK